MSEEKEVVAEEAVEVVSESSDEELSEEEVSEESASSGDDTTVEVTSEPTEDEIEDIEEFDDDEEEEDDEEVEAEDVQYKTEADKLFFRTIPRNASRRLGKLRQHLVAPIEFRLKEPHAVYSLDWSKEEIVVSSEPNKSASCSIDISEKHLFEIVEGQLNPQVAMLSEKIGIKGDMGIAMYAFNLFVRRGRRK